MSKEETPFVDWRGVEIKVGALVVYPVRQSSSVWMTEGRVEELHYNEDGTPGGVTVTRLRATGWRGDDIKPDHRVRVGLDRLTVVVSAEQVEWEKYPIRYVVHADQEGVPQVIEGLDSGIWTIGDGSEIEIDGRAS